ncbi:hypothetical protein [Nocardioides sp.]|uniref:hypothetical protein n=1 Tax=Nocardioides sp. TaxID=35761 RepID=UPI0039E43F0D
MTSETPETPEISQADASSGPRQDAFRAAAPERTGPTTLTRVRRLVAQLIWIVCSIAALLLALGALFIAFKANADNALVKWVMDAADWLDLGVFDKDEGIKQWTSENAATKNALFNWGLGALAWLVAGRLLDRLIRPKSV